MSFSRKTFRAYAELGRISNLPTCLSNVLVGTAIGGLDGEVSLARFLLSALSVCLLYLAGMASNDLFDLEVDRKERPERPIPSGRITRAAALRFTVLCFGAGLSILFVLGTTCFAFGAALAISILAYNKFHKTVPASTAFMGVCRGLVYAVAATASAGPVRTEVLVPLAVTLALYTICVTVVARSENSDEGKATGATIWFAAIPLALVLLAPVWIRPHETVIVSAILGAALFAWSFQAFLAIRKKPPRVKTAILTWLSGMCLLDAFFLALLDRPVWAGLAVAAFLATTAGHRKILGT